MKVAPKRMAATISKTVELPKVAAIAPAIWSV